MPALCRDCDAMQDGTDIGRCARCGGRRLVRHAEIARLTLAHLDCDAFYATIEKRDDPRLRDRPVIVGGGRRGVVAAACYVARRYGVRSAMPMFKALDACPDAVVVRPSMAKYGEVGREVRALMLSVTPLVEPISIDEAYLDLEGCEAVHGRPAAAVLAGLARRIEEEIGITVSIGLSFNKFLAKIASDLDKPRGFAVIGRGEATRFLADKPVSLISGVGAVTAARLAQDGITRIGHLQAASETELAGRYGSTGSRLFRLARGEDPRPVVPERETKSVSVETTFETDERDLGALDAHLARLAVRLSERLDRKGLAAAGVSLKLKRADFSTLTRARHLETPTADARRLHAAAAALLAPLADGTPYRLIGIGTSALAQAERADPPDLFDTLNRSPAPAGPEPTGADRPD